MSRIRRLLCLIVCIFLQICSNVRLVLVRDLPRHCPPELEKHDLTKETRPILLGFQKSSPKVYLSVLFSVWPYSANFVQFVKFVFVTVREPYSAFVVSDCIFQICSNVRLVLVRDLPAVTVHLNSKSGT